MKKNKALMLVIVLGLFLLLSSCNSNQRIKSGKDITMFVATDIHFLSKNLIDQGEAYQKYVDTGDGRQLFYIEEIVSAFTQDVIDQNPDILIISGDLTNNGEKESHLQLAKKFNEIEKSGTRIFVIPGNHDIDNPWARRFEGDKQIVTDSISVEDFSSIYKDYGYAEAILKDDASLSYLAAPSEDLWLLMLDTNQYEYNVKSGKPYTGGKVREETLDWIRECSKKAKEENATIITVMHHNLYRHNAVLHYGYTLDNSEDVYELFRELDLNLVFSGHLHIQDIKSRQVEDKSLYDIASSALIMYPNQYGILNYTPDQGFDYKTIKVAVEDWAKENDIEDDKLLNFSEYTKERFADASYQKSYKALSKSSEYTEEEKELMSETMSILNLNYFSGTSGLIKSEIIKSKGYKLWETVVEPEFFRDYILSMVPNREDDQNYLQIPSY